MSERLQPGADGNRHRDPHVKPLVDLREINEGGGGKIEGTRQVKDNTIKKIHNQLTWAHKGTQRLNHRTEKIQGMDLGPQYI